MTSKGKKGESGQVVSQPFFEEKGEKKHKDMSIKNLPPLIFQTEEGKKNNSRDSYTKGRKAETHSLTPLLPKGKERVKECCPSSRKGGEEEKADATRFYGEKGREEKRSSSLSEEGLSLFATWGRGEEKKGGWCCPQGYEKGEEGAHAFAAAVLKKGGRKKNSGWASQKKETVTRRKPAGAESVIKKKKREDVARCDYSPHVGGGKKEGRKKVPAATHQKKRKKTRERDKKGIFRLPTRGEGKRNDPYRRTRKGERRSSLTFGKKKKEKKERRPTFHYS